MGHFTVTVNPETGLKDIEQVPTHEDARADRHAALDAKIDTEIDSRVDADLAAELERDMEESTPPALTVEDGGDEDPPADEAANECMVGLYSENVAWAKKLVAKIQTQAGIKAVRVMEKEHPDFEDNDPPGRKGVLNALQERSGEIMDGQTESDGLERRPGSADDEGPL